MVFQARNHTESNLQNESGDVEHHESLSYCRQLIHLAVVRRDFVVINNLMLHIARYNLHTPVAMENRIILQTIITQQMSYIVVVYP